MAEPEVQSTFHSKNANEPLKGLQEANGLAQNICLKGLSLGPENVTFSVQIWETETQEFGPKVSLERKGEALCF